MSHCPDCLQDDCCCKEIKKEMMSEEEKCPTCGGRAKKIPGKHRWSGASYEIYKFCIICRLGVVSEEFWNESIENSECYKPDWEAVEERGEKRDYATYLCTCGEATIITEDTNNPLRCVCGKLIQISVIPISCQSDV